MSDGVYHPHYSCFPIGEKDLEFANKHKDKYLDNRTFKMSEDVSIYREEVQEALDEEDFGETLDVMYDVVYFPTNKRIGVFLGILKISGNRFWWFDSIQNAFADQ